MISNIRQGDPRALLDQAFGIRGAEPAGGTGKKNDTIVKPDTLAPQVHVHAFDLRVILQCL